MQLIYGLVDPDTKLVRYVGKSVNGMSRPKAHMKPHKTLRTLEVRAKISASNKGKKHSLEHNAKYVAARSGKVRPPEAISAGLTGKKRGPYKKKIKPTVAQENK